ncbi:MAG: hypothetical protein ABSA70_05060 [Terriglobia bacterium]
MRKEHCCAYRKTAVWIIAAVVLGLGIGASVASAQFGLKLPKIPKVGKKESKPATESKEKAAQLPAVEITSITPDSASPGAAGEIVLTGKNFFLGMRLRMGCGEEQGSPESLKNYLVKVESPERATIQVKIPENAKEGPCTLYVVGYWGRTGVVTDETDESPSGTPEITQISPDKVLFRISNSGSMPISVPVFLAGEGNMQFMEIMMKFSQSMQGNWGQGGGKSSLLLSPDTVKYVQDDKTVFTEPTSGVTKVEEMSMMGQPSGVFRIVFKSGKIYNFMDQSQGGPDKSRAFKTVKKRLGK